MTKIMKASLKSLIGILIALSSASYGSMEPLDDQEMAQVVGQSLFVADKIGPDALPGNNSYTDNTYYRMGMDVDLELNANIDKFQLGCGGVNNNLASGCDIDMDYVRLMGRNGSGPGDPVASDFLLKRPYFEFAVKNDDSKTMREVIGIKVGAQTADGYFGVGRTYQNGEVNQETGGTCNTSDSPGTGVANCHSGLNSISGFLDIEMSATVPITAEAFFGLISFDGNACFGNTARGDDNCNASGNEFRHQVSGTRMNAVALRDVELNIDLSFLDDIGIDSAYADIFEPLKFIHGFALQNTSDFSLSLQRERVAWPTYQKDGYANTANTGWWMNVPDVKVLDMNGDRVTLSGLDEIGNALSEGINLENVELGQTPPNNCYGGTRFC